jgi:integrase
VSHEKFEVFMATIVKREDSKGNITYQVKIRKKGYPVETATFTRKTDASKWARDTESAMDDGRYFKTAESKKHTLAELIDRYIKSELPHRKSDQQKFEMHLNWWKDNIGSYLLSDVTPAILGEYRDKLQEEPIGKDESGNDKYRSNATINRYMASLSIALTKASKEWGWIELNPMFNVSKKKESRGRIRFLSDDERNNLLEACEHASNPLINLLVIIALSTGARFSEILNLKWNEIDLKRKMFYFMDTKNGENRAVPISSKAYELLTRHSKIRKINSEFVFARPDGIKPMDLRHQWEEAIKKADLTDFRFHDLRHTAASYLAMNGATLVEISDILGHKTMQMVKRYSHLTQKHTAEVLERMNEKQFKNIEK